MTTHQNRTHYDHLDAADPLTALRELFATPTGVYLCGNSLGLMPRNAPAAVAQVTATEWANDAVNGWAKHGWRERPQQIGDRIAAFIGAQPGETLATDTTAINLYKVLDLALAINAPRSIIITERENFPADMFIMQSLAEQHAAQLWAVTPDELTTKIEEAGDQLAVLCLADVNYRDGSRHNITDLTAAAHTVGALAIWDLAHSAGAAPTNLTAANADFAVGCGYKYLNGGPGAPAFVWAHTKHHATLADPTAPNQPLTSWLGHATPFDFTTTFTPSPGAMHFLTSSPSQIGLAALSAGIATHEAAVQLAGPDALWQKSIELTTLFMTRITQKLPDVFRIVTPTDPTTRGSQVSLAGVGELAGAEQQLIHALAADGVVGDFRVGERRPEWHTPDYLRFGFAPLYTRRVDVVDAVDILEDIVTSGRWRTSTVGGTR